MPPIGGGSPSGAQSSSGARARPPTPTPGPVARVTGLFWSLLDAAALFLRSFTDPTAVQNHGKKNVSTSGANVRGLGNTNNNLRSSSYRPPSMRSRIGRVGDGAPVKGQAGG